MTERRSSRPRGRPDLVFRKVGDEWLLFDPRTQRIHVLNLTAALVWSHCTGEYPVSQIVRRVAEAFPDEPPSRVEPSVREILRRFRDERLLDEGPGDGARSHGGPPAGEPGGERA